MLRDSFVLNFRDELDAWKLRCADVIFSERRESRPQQIMPGEELRGRVKSTEGHSLFSRGQSRLLSLELSAMGATHLCALSPQNCHVCAVS